jgi:hypothetical protein
MGSTLCETVLGYCETIPSMYCSKCDVTQCLLNSICVEIPEGMCLGYQGKDTSNK